jgi:hypothetical protein
MVTGSEEAIPLSPIIESDCDSKAPTTTASLGGIVKLASTLSPDDRLRIIGGVWASLPPWHAAAPTEAQLVELQRELENYDTAGAGRFGWPVVRKLIAAGCPKETPKIYSAPRRFDLSTIFVVTLAYSLLFGVMSAASFPPGVSVAMAGFITFVGLGQAFLFGGNQPRTASLVVGALILTLSMLAVWLITGPRMYPTAAILAVLCYLVVGGAILGYLAGVLVGSVFLISDKLRKRFSRRSNERTQDGVSGAAATDAGGDSPWAD